MPPSEPPIAVRKLRRLRAVMTVLSVVDRAASSMSCRGRILTARLDGTHRGRNPDWPFAR